MKDYKKDLCVNKQKGSLLSRLLRILGGSCKVCREELWEVLQRYCVSGDLLRATMGQGNVPGK